MKKYIIAGLAALLTVSAVMSFSGFAVSLGEVNGDSDINALDAADVLVHSANVGSGNGGTLSEDALTAADVNADGDVNSKDAAEILVYAAVQGAGGIYRFSGAPAEEPPLTASIDVNSVRYNRTDQTLYFTFSYENLPEECSALFLVVPENTPHTQSDALNAYIAAAYLSAQIGYAGFNLSAEKAPAGSYELRIYDQEKELDCVTFNVAPPLEASIQTDSVSVSNKTVSASFTSKYLESNSSAWVGIVPHDTEHSESAASANALTKKNLTECSNHSIELNLPENVSAGMYDLRIYDPNNGGAELSSAMFEVILPLTAKISSVSYHSSSNTISVAVTTANVQDDCSAWIGIVPASTSRTYSASYSARKTLDYLTTWLKYNQTSIDAQYLSAGNYEVRICDPMTQTVLDWAAVTVPEKTPAWKKSYKSKVSGLSSGYMYSLYDVNSDGIPELFASNGDYKQNQVAVYTYKNSSLISLGSYGRYGTVFANAGGYLMDYTTAKGCDLRTYYYFNGSSITEKDYLLYNEDYGTYAVNGNDVSKSTYNSYYSKYNKYSYKELGQSYSRSNTSPIDNY